MAGDKWFEIGVQLGLSLQDLNDIREKNKDIVTRRLVDVLGKWQQNEGQKATVQRLLDCCEKEQVRGAVWAALQRM